MNHREQTHLRAGVRRALHSLTLLLLPIVAPKALSAFTPNRARPDQPKESGSDQAPPPYLPVLGSPALRFQAAPPPPDLTSRPAAAAPPLPALSPTENTVAQANLAAAHPIASATPGKTPEPPPESAKVAPVPGTPAKPAPPPILPDDSAPSVRPEDFLPYFQVPGAGRSPAGVNVIMPGVPGASGSLPVPPSSATYTQTPK
jgi:hypothetical protein